ncbi:MAG: UDP-N-acetylglucosamine 1-carboxyvinyltransferase [Chloroflexota bacterium]|nr:UDP-N-acetylglucosamine 1-carboxyvinyltransferase [Chloroflexota bacterium]
MAGERFIIEGGRRLEGSVAVSGSKNASVAAIPAALLVPEDCYLENVPAIGDVKFMAQVLESLGGEAERTSPSTLRLNAAHITSFSPATELVVNLRASFLVMGALLARFGQAMCSPPGGDVIGQRPIDVHLAGFAAMGADIHRQGEKFVAQAKRLRGARIFMDYPSVLGTQNLMMAGTLARGTTVIINAASEPEIASLAEMLNNMGARIHGAGSHTVEIEGVDALHGARHRIIPDRIEAGTFAIAAAITGGDVRICQAEPAHLHSLVAKLKEVGVQVEEDGTDLRVRGTGQLGAVTIQALPYPGLATDLQAPMAALLTQAQGVSYIHERVFENRLLYVSELRKLGAEVVSTGTTAIISGPTPLIGTSVRALDIRAGAALVLAGLAARGKTEISDIYHLNRGYQCIDEKLRSLGADIQSA